MSLSDYSDLTELSSSEDEQFQPATKSKKSKKQPKQYKITNVLRPPRTTQYTAKSLYGISTHASCPLWALTTSDLDQIIDNSIDLDPEYQRGMFPSRTNDSRIYPLFARYRMVRREADRSHRFNPPQLLHATNHFW